MKCKSCDNGLTEFEESLQQCEDCILKESIIDERELYRLKFSFYKLKLHEALKDCNFNGAGMRELLSEFESEVVGK